jgi:flavin-dependent thymidylate synthase
MRVELLDYTGKGQPDPGDYAAKLLIIAKSTRLEQKAETRNMILGMKPEQVKAELDAIVMTIRSSWEFVDMMFQITGVTRAFTHQFVRSRHCSFAQEAMRVTDQSNFTTLMPIMILRDTQTAKVWDSVMDAIRIGYRNLRSADISAQDARGLLPTNVLTNIIMKCNLRTFAELVGKRDNLRAQGEYTEVVKAMTTEVMKVYPWVLPFLYPPRKATPALDTILKQALGSASPVDMPEVNKALKELDALKGTWG